MPAGTRTRIMGLIPTVALCGPSARQALKPIPGNTGVMGDMLGISVAEVVLHRPQISALVGEIIAAAVTQHVGPNPAQFCLLAGKADDVVYGLAGELCLPLRHEQPGQVVLAGGEVALNGAQLVTSNRRRYAV
jgi:hypothetical protein